MNILDKLPKPPKQDDTIDWSKADIEKLSKKFEESDLSPEVEAQWLKEKEAGLHPGNR